MSLKLNSKYREKLKKDKVLIKISKITSSRMCDKPFDIKFWGPAIGMPLMLCGPLIYKAIEGYIIASNKMTISVEMTLLKLFIGSVIGVAFPIIAIIFFLAVRTSFITIFLARCVFDIFYAIFYVKYLVKQNIGID